MKRRSGLTLLEVVFAMAIFLMSIVALYQLFTLGSDRALDVKLLARTSLCCQAKIDEVMIGAEALSSTGYTNYTDEFNKDLQWKIDATSDTVSGLWELKVSVKAELPGGKIIESQLCRMMLDPSNRGSTTDQPYTPPSSSSNSSTPSTTTPSSPSTSSPSTPSTSSPSSGTITGGGGGGNKTGGGGGTGTGGSGGAGGTGGGGKSGKTGG